MDLRKLKKIIKLIKEEDIAEIEIEDEDGFLRVSRVAQATGAPIYTAPSAPAPSSTVSVETEEKEEKGNLHYVTAPMVGTFYASPAPDAAPYVKVGDVVKKGQTLCIIEAMKVMNEIKSDVSGKIVEILVENAAPVEFGQELFAIEPQGG